MNLRDAKFAAIDVETTGLNPKKDEILALGIVPIEGTKIIASESYYTLVRPNKFKVEAIKIHGIDPKTLQNAPSFAEIADDIFDLLHDRILVGHSVELDYEFLRRAFEDAGYDFIAKTIDISTLEQILAKKLGEKLVWENKTLEGLAKKYGISCSYRHNALADAFIAAQIFQIQLVKLIKYGVNTLEKLLDLIEAEKDSKAKFEFLSF